MSTFVRLADLEFSALHLSDGAVLLRPCASVDDELTLPRLGQALHDRRPIGVADVIATTTEICLVTEAGVTEELLVALSELDVSSPDAPARTCTIPVLANGPDWQAVEAFTQLTRHDYLTSLARCEVTVAMFGFLPGFTYLVGLPSELRCPRKDTPATAVEAGSVAVGGPYIGIYGTASPAGWHVLGRTPLSIAHPQEVPPMALRVGDRIRFRIIDDDEHESLAGQSLAIESG